MVMMPNEVFYPSLQYVVLTLAVWSTYWYSLKAGFVSDDIMGIAEYDGKFQGWQYGMISRWVRYHLCGGNFPSKHKLPDGKQIPQGKIPTRHHLLSIIVFNLAILFCHFALTPIIGSKISLLSLLLFIVHPVTIQGVAWISGIGYPLCLFWISASLSLLSWFHSGQYGIWTSLLVYILFTLIQYLAVNALFTAIMFWVILLFLGWWKFAIISALVSLWLGFNIVKETISHRANEFKKQNMGASTFVKPRKLIVAVKTLYYYIRLLVFPNRLGLYHKWGYHYNADTEREDGVFICGLLSIGFIIYSVNIIGSPIYTLGILWFLVFISIFLNLITIQQFIAERYAVIPCLGFAIAVSYFLQYYPSLYWAIFSLLLMRTWMHLPTYDNELRFYLSNTWNFPDSEVAYGNLGVTYLRVGMIGSALDTWVTSTKINPNYDVPHYNLFSHYRANADAQVRMGNYQQAVELFKMAFPHIQNCMKCEIVHFKDQWQKELEAIQRYISDPLQVVREEEARQRKLREELIKRTDEGALSSIRDIDLRLQHISKIYEDSKAGVPPPRPQA